MSYEISISDRVIEVPLTLDNRYYVPYLSVTERTIKYTYS